MTQTKTKTRSQDESDEVQRAVSTHVSEGSDDDSFIDILSDLDEAYDVQITIEGYDIVVYDVDENRTVVADIFEVAESDKDIRDLLEDRVGSITNLAVIDDIQTELIDKYWTGEGFQIQCRQTEAGNFELYIPYHNTGIVVDRFDSRDDLDRVKQLTEHSSYTVDDFYSVFTDTDFIVTKDDDAYTIRMYDESYVEPIEDRYDKSEYKLSVLEDPVRRSVNKSYDGVYTDDKPVDLISVATACVFTAGSAFYTVSVIESLFLSSLSDLFGGLLQSLVSMSVFVATLIIVGTILIEFGKIFAFAYSLLIKPLRRVEHRFWSSKYRPVYKIEN